MEPRNEELDVPNLTDWLNTPLAGLMPVEQAFRCHVCKDFYNSPMLTSCNHTFCSICIRRYLSTDPTCPLCRAKVEEVKLRGNWALREAVDAFVQARDTLLQVARKPVAAPSPPKRKAAEYDETHTDGRENKRHRMSTRSRRVKGGEVTAAMMREEYDAIESDDSTYSEPDDGLVACPICQKRMKVNQVDPHLEASCVGPPDEQSSSASRSRGNPNSNSRSARPAVQISPQKTRPERLPALAYSMIKDGALRKKMAELGLSTAGSRPMLERRHQEWVIIWNANCDSAKPKKRFELLHDLEVWEKTMGTRAPTSSRAAILGAQIKDKNFDREGWANKNKNSFQDLIANARRTRNQVEKQNREASEEQQKDSEKQRHEQLPEVMDLTGPSSQPEGKYKAEGKSKAEVEGEGESKVEMDIPLDEGFHPADYSPEPPHYGILEQPKEMQYVPHQGPVPPGNAEMPIQSKPTFLPQ
ncbi:hypothetical protein B0H67DRAFT_488576 [Lasiosphaeris hirsuta]|uniref:Postreplication repair E3 ubiquitin-protein ligase RAD18 n=1 Tax=Lasiosphaeris hirsuta TaxID=260670 RepID=A0AA40AFI7_9PEZI|nr:hypothetical protein B0H67DRAFT_488576 [Lasiosphaeris hirsuta]